jgi:hypothetical protein
MNTHDRVINTLMTIDVDLRVLLESLLLYTELSTSSSSLSSYYSANSDLLRDTIIESATFCCALKIMSVMKFFKFFTPIVKNKHSPQITILKSHSLSTSFK